MPTRASMSTSAGHSLYNVGDALPGRDKRHSPRRNRGGVNRESNECVTLANVQCAREHLCALEMSSEGLRIQLMLSRCFRKSSERADAWPRRLLQGRCGGSLARPWSSKRARTRHELNGLFDDFLKDGKRTGASDLGDDLHAAIRLR
jgi:hypothetical protein